MASATPGREADMAFEDAPAAVHKHVAEVAAAAAHSLRLWAWRPPALHKPSFMTLVLQQLVSCCTNYLCFPWEPGQAHKARQQAMVPGFLPAFSAACVALAGGLAQASSAAEVAFDVPGLCTLLLSFWKALLATFRPGKCIMHSDVAAATPCTAQLAVAVLRCWAGPGSAAASRSSNPGGARQALHITLDVLMHLVRDIYCFADPHSSFSSSDFKLQTPLPGGLAASQHVQWLLSCHAALVAQLLHKQQRGRSMAAPLTPGSSSSSQTQHDQQQQQQQQQQMKVAAVHKRLLEGLEMQGDVIAADARVYAAVESGLLPALLQQLPAAVIYAVQSARQVQQRLGYVRGDSSRPVTLMAILLAEVLPSTGPGQQLLLESLQCCSFVQLLEQGLRSWGSSIADQPCPLASMPASLMAVQRLCHVLVAALASKLGGEPPAAATAAAAAAAAQMHLLYGSSEVLALTARYCCGACQESHWKAHKAACRALAAAQAHGGAQQQ
ncbi:hypothetical protein OEZ85_003652 [Tetradesmus obliquus]|uniref:MYND-type domain-containing protein n=1 Tax=Tetradesmus obliquus TaxID=3088 RepID=A0ABY8UC96_TETOB|nr:hypothetical protein OEZ85_003652 [Tetradesmus obliquus]